MELLEKKLSAPSSHVRPRSCESVDWIGGFWWPLLSGFTHRARYPIPNLMLSLYQVLSFSFARFLNLSSVILTPLLVLFLVCGPKKN